MAAGEDQLEPLVGDGRLLVLRELRCPCQELRFPRERLLAPDPVDRRVARGRDDPRARVGRSSVAWPPLRRPDERVLHRVLGEVEVTEDAAEDRDGLRALVAVGSCELVYATVS